MSTNDSETNKGMQLLQLIKWLIRDEALPELLEFFNQDSRKSEIGKETRNNTFSTNHIEKLLFQLSMSKISTLTKTEIRMIGLFAEHKALTLQEIQHILGKKTYEYPRSLCKNFLSYGWLKYSTRKRFEGAPFHIYHLPYATKDDLDQAEKRYLELNPKLQSEAPTTPLKRFEREIKTPPPTVMFVCQECGRSFKREKKPLFCPYNTCDGQNITIYQENGASQCKKLVFDKTTGKQRQCTRNAVEDSVFCSDHLRIAKKDAIELNEGEQYQVMDEEEVATENE